MFSILKEPTDRPGITRTKTILALIVVVLVAVGAYGVLNFQTQTSSNVSQTSTTSGSQQPGALLSLFGTFSHMGVSYVLSNADLGNTVENVTYAVLGHTLANSTDYYRVEFTNLRGNTTTILWFDQQGSVGLAQVPGGKNYTGGLALPFSQWIMSLFSYALVDSNATQLIGLQKTGGDVVQNIGGMQLTVSTYELIPSTTSPIANEIVRVAAIPGTNIRLVVYLNQTPVDPESSSTFFQVNSLSKG